MKKLQFSDGSVGMRDKGMWLEVEGITVVATEMSALGVEAAQHAPTIVPVENKHYDVTKPVKDTQRASSSNGHGSSPTIGGGSISKPE